MSDNFVAVLERMRDAHQRHLRNLLLWKEAGGELRNYPEGQTLEDFITRETAAVENLSLAIERWNRMNT
jgi:hypothetical protein